MKEIHKPSRTQAIVFFLFTLLLALGIFAWSVFFNKGTLIIEGDFPLTIKAGVEEKTCASSPCRFKLSPRPYSVSIAKDGFFDDIHKVRISRSKETKIISQLKFIPVLREVGELVSPTPTAPLRTPFLGIEKLERFPKNAKTASFSPSGNQALITLGKELYLYDLRKKELNEINLTPELTPTWSGEDIFFLEKSQSTHIVKKWGREKNESIVVFERPFKNPALLGDFTGTKILIIDLDEGNFSYYLIDLLKKSRKRLEIAQTWRNAKWTIGHIIFEDQKNATQNIFAMDANTLKTFPLEATNSENVLEIEPGVFIFLSAEPQDSERKKLGPSIEEALEQASKETFEEQKQNSSFFITEFRLADNLYRTLATVQTKQDEAIHRLTYDVNSKKLYFVQGKKLFEVVLEKA